jgi:cellulose synthase/poly-beta-1,6-N-acetylglucosamine synthase-like glycosyltransferase
VKASVVIPVQNRSEILGGTLSAIAHQDFPKEELEVLVCDDGSEEDIRFVVEKFRSIIPFLRWLKQPGKGPAAARNLGIKGVSTPIVIFLDSDVLAERSMIRHLLRGFEENPEWLGVEARIIPVGGEENPMWDGPTCFHGGRYHTGAVAYRRDVLTDAGGFDETFKMPACEDVELAARVLSRGVIGFVPEAMAYHPRRPVTLRLHWNWRRFWKYEMFLAKRYGILSFPENSAGRLPRLRVALAAIATLPGGRLLEACKHIKKDFSEALSAAFFAFFDMICGLLALPGILFSPVPPRKSYLENPSQRV